jgi:Flp pilus assembly protein TadD
VKRRSPVGLVLLLLLGCATESIAPELRRGDLALAEGEAEDAADAFESALSVRPEHPRALHGLARSYVARGDGESALVIFNELKQLHPVYFRDHAQSDEQVALRQVARSRLWHGDPAGSLRLIRKLDAAGSDDPTLRDLRSRALIAESGRLLIAGRDDEAATLYREATGEDPGSGSLAAHLAEKLLENGQTGTAISVLSDALLRSPDDGRLVSLMDRALDIRYPDTPRSRRPGRSGVRERRRHE